LPFRSKALASEKGTSFRVAWDSLGVGKTLGDYTGEIRNRLPISANTELFGFP
jgi:hypothetical protein